MIVIGRSGTGKTTCALMRLFAIELLYKNKESKKLLKNKPNTAKGNYINEVYGLRNIFLTASPILILEIQQKYDELVSHVVKELNKIEEREKSSGTIEDSILTELD